ncbi:MAG: polysaccharide deacetylase family protein [Kiritimatiellae bacterium]|jgi:peptidoglycan/xylan/chitin deacetylase (PgdA/CDA1 family)|nr:polysaccharide deacetylase family protein [Kiritimatiellia bacterium]
MKIIMYHYVRRLETTPFPEIKALHTDAFAHQLDWLAARYPIVSGHALMDAVTGGPSLPENAVLLTFDDGYRDCLTDVAPLLRKHGVTACFFPVAGCVEQDVVLDVNKIQFVLAAAPLESILEELRGRVDAAAATGDCPGWEQLRAEYERPNKWDPGEVQLVKKLLQHALPDPYRSDAVRELFFQHVTRDEATFSRELYCDKNELLLLREQGHFLGGHGLKHRRMDYASPEDLTAKIHGIRAFLSRLGVEEPWCICYPHGGHNDALLPELHAANCRLGLTVNVRDAHLDRDNPLCLPRWNTNDFPPKGTAGVSG